MEVLKSNCAAADAGVVQAEQGAGGTCQGGGGDEGNQLVLGDVDAHALGGDPVVPDGHDSPAGPAAHQVQHHHQGDHHQHKAHGKGGDAGVARGALGALDDLDAVFAEAQSMDMLLVPSTFRAMCRPFSSQPTSRQLIRSLMISPKARVTMAR